MCWGRVRGRKGSPCVRGDNWEQWGESFLHGHAAARPRGEGRPPATLIHWHRLTKASVCQTHPWGPCQSMSLDIVSAASQPAYNTLLRPHSVYCAHRTPVPLLSLHSPITVAFCLGAVSTSVTHGLSVARAMHPWNDPGTRETERSQRHCSQVPSTVHS